LALCAGHAQRRGRNHGRQRADPLGTAQLSELPNPANISKSRNRRTAS
jgi:hypothetical protein